MQTHTGCFSMSVRWWDAAHIVKPGIRLIVLICLCSLCVWCPLFLCTTTCVHMSKCSHVFCSMCIYLPPKPLLSTSVMACRSPLGHRLSVSLSVASVTFKSGCGQSQLNGDQRASLPSSGRGWIRSQNTLDWIIPEEVFMPQQKGDNGRT